MRSLRYSDVFVPGGFPRHTYNPRLSLQLEERLKEVRHNLCKLVTVTGHTKSGKTVLVRKILPREECVWVDGGTTGEEDDFWHIVLDQLNLFQTIEKQSGNEQTNELSASGSGEANFLIAKGKAEIGSSLSSMHGSSASQSRTISSRVAALNGLKIEGRPLVVDDFHYLPKDLQGNLIRALKPLIFEGLPVVIIAIPHRRYDAIKVEKEITGRILPIVIPLWTEDELRFIPETGFRLLNTTISSSVVDRLTKESIGSPHLMQDFCRAICKKKSLEDSRVSIEISLTDDELHQVYADIAETIGRPIFEKLARGPRQRADRIPRILKNGTQVDIYGLVLHAMAYLKPGLVTLEYEDFRSAIRLVSTEDVPQMHEVARVLKHMADIAATDQSSTPVIDFDDEEKRLHVTDPFFAFYLRWGRIEN